MKVPASLLLPPALAAVLALAAAGQGTEIRFEDLDAEIAASEARLAEAEAAADETAVARIRQNLEVFAEARRLLASEARMASRREQLEIDRRRAERRRRDLDWYYQPSRIVAPDEIDADAMRRIVEEEEVARAGFAQAAASLEATRAEQKSLAGVETALETRRVQNAKDQEAAAGALEAATEETRSALVRRVAVLAFERVYIERRLRQLSAERILLGQAIPVRETERENAQLYADYMARKLKVYQARYEKLVSRKVEEARRRVDEAIRDHERAVAESRPEYEILILERTRHLAVEDLALQEAQHERTALQADLTLIQGLIDSLTQEYERPRQEYAALEALDETDSIRLRRLFEDLTELEVDYRRRWASQLPAVRAQIERSIAAADEAQRASARLQSNLTVDKEQAEHLLSLLRQSTPSSTRDLEEWRTLRRSRIGTLEALAEAHEELAEILSAKEERIEDYGARLAEYQTFFQEKRFWLREKTRIDWASFRQVGRDLAKLPRAAIDLLADLPARLAWSNARIADHAGPGPIAVLVALFASLVLWFVHLRGRVDRIRRELMNKRRPTPVDRFVHVLLTQVETGLPVACALLLAGVLAWFFAVRGPLMETTLVLLTTFYLDLQIVRLLDKLLRPGGDRIPRIIAWIDDRLADHLLRRTRWLVRLTLVFVPLGYLLGRLGYPNTGFLDAWWLAYKTGLAANLIWILSDRRSLHALAPAGDTPGRRALRMTLSLAAPILIVGIASLYALDLRGYRQAASYFATASALSFVAVVGIIVLYNVALDLATKRMREIFRVRFAETPEAEREEENQRQLFLYRVSEIVFFWISVAAAVSSVAALFQFTLSEARALAEAPIPVLGRAVSLWDLVRAILFVYFALRLAEILRGLERHFIFPRTHISAGAEYTIQAATRYSIIGLGVALALGAIHLHLSELQWFMAAAGIGIGFGLQEVIANFICGVLLLVERPIQIGDYIIIDGIHGQIYEITIRATTIRTFDGNSLIYPNKHFITGRIQNMTHVDPRIRRDLSIGVAYGSDVKLTKKVLQEVLVRDGRILNTPPPEILFDAFGDSSLNFVLRFWPDPTSGTGWPQLKSDVNSAVEAALRRAGLEIPFPQRDLHVRSVARPVAELVSGAPPAATPGPVVAGPAPRPPDGP